LISVSCECFMLSSKRFLLRADHSSRDILPSVVCLSVIVKPRYWIGPGRLEAVVPWGKRYGQYERFPSKVKSVAIYMMLQ